jgi:hypothetical protein
VNAAKGASRIEVRLARRDDTLVIEVDDGGGTHLRAELPCGS